MKECILNILKEGLQGDKESIYKWFLMIQDLLHKGLSDNLSDYKKKFNKIIVQKYKERNIQQISIEIFNNTIQELLNEKKIEIVGQYNEYQYKNKEELNFYNQNIDYSFVSTNFSFQPLQFVRSKVQRFCKLHNISQTSLDDIIIAVTEASENAIKYADKPVVAIKQKFKKNTYSIKIINSMKEITSSDEVNVEKFSEDVSLMRGVLIMSKLMDNIDIIQNTKKQRVIFTGSKKIICN